MGVDNIVVAMPVLSRTLEEARLLEAALQALARLQLPIVAADAGSHLDLIKYLETVSNLTLLRLQRGPGSALVQQVKAALAEAATRQSAFILYTEPDKKWFFEHRLCEFLEFRKQHQNAGIIVASRDESSFSTFPATQQLTEQLTNRLLSRLFGVEADFLYGPLIIHSKLVSYLHLIPDDLGWGWRIFIMAVAHRLGWPLIPFEAPLPCPAEQRSEDDEKSRLYRIEQMAQNVRGVRAGLGCPL